MSDLFERFGEGFKEGVQGAFRIVIDHENPLDVARDIQKNANNDKEKEELNKEENEN